jgi:hypothetical protein
MGFGEPSAIALRPVAILWLRNRSRLRSEYRGDDFDGERCADCEHGTGTIADEPAGSIISEFVLEWRFATTRFNAWSDGQVYCASFM